LKLSQLHALIAVADTGSIRAAARRVGLTQPGLSKSLRALEEELGVTLVNRTSSGVSLTPFGLATLKRGRGISQELDRLRSEVHQMRGRLDGQISVAVSPSPALLLMPKVLARFHQAYPSVQVHVCEAVYPDTLRLLREGLVDMALGAHPPPTEVKQREFMVQPLYANRLVVCARAGHPLAACTTLAELLHSPWVLHGPEDGPGSMFAPTFRAGGLEPPRAWTVSHSLVTTLGLIENTDSLSLLPQRLVEHASLKGRLTVLPLTDLEALAEVVLVVRAAQTATPMARKLMDMLRRTPA
jgi:LysR family transcriptional regulator of abg operon